MKNSTQTMVLWLCATLVWQGTAAENSTGAAPAAGARLTEAIEKAAIPADSAEPASTPANRATRPPSAENADLRLNFRGVSLETILDYLSEAAGFIIIKETDVKGKVDVWSNQPLTREEAVDLLNTILNKNGYAAIRKGRTLTIVSRDEAKMRNIPVKTGGDAEKIPATDEMVTQIIPVRHANVQQMMTNLRPLIGTYAEMTVNESANSLIITATQTDIKRMTEIINGLDESIASTSTIRVFPLKYADAKELATVLATLFPANPQGGTRGGATGSGFGNGFTGGGFPGGGFPGGGFPGGGFQGGGQRNGGQGGGAIDVIRGN